MGKPRQLKQPCQWKKRIKRCQVCYLQIWSCGECNYTRMRLEGGLLGWLWHTWARQIYKFSNCYTECLLSDFSFMWQWNKQCWQEITMGVLRILLHAEYCTVYTWSFLLHCSHKISDCCIWIKASFVFKYMCYHFSVCTFWQIHWNTYQMSQIRNVINIKLI